MTEKVLPLKARCEGDNRHKSRKPCRLRGEAGGEERRRGEAGGEERRRGEMGGKVDVR